MALFEIIVIFAIARIKKKRACICCSSYLCYRETEWVPFLLQWENVISKSICHKYCEKIFFYDRCNSFCNIVCPNEMLAKFLFSISLHFIIHLNSDLCRNVGRKFLKTVTVYFSLADIINLFLEINSLWYEVKVGFYAIFLLDFLPFKQLRKRKEKETWTRNAS